MGEPAFDIKDANRWFAVRFNNEAWDIVEADDRGKDQSDRMLAAAYAAWCHWSVVGTPLNEQRARHLLATVHAELGHSELALVHAARCMELSDHSGTAQNPFDRGCAFECLARANASAGRKEDARSLKQQAHNWARMIAEGERDAFLQRLSSGRWYGVE